MTDAVAAPAPVPPAPAAPVRGAPRTRLVLLAACSIGGTLTASLASASQVNWPFAIVSAIFGGILVVVTAAPAIAASAPPRAVAPSATGQAAAPVASLPAGFGVIGIGIAAAVLSFIMNQVAQLFVGYAVFSVVPAEVTQDDFLVITSLIGIAVLGVRVPFDLLIGAYLLGRARNILFALGAFILTYLFCYLLEQVVSMFFGYSGLFNTLQSGVPAFTVLSGLGLVFGVPLLAQAVGAYGTRIAAYVMRGR